MPLSLFKIPPRETFQISNASQDITAAWVGKYGYCTLTADRTFTLDLNDISTANFEIDIRVSADSTGAAIIAIQNGTIDVNDTLGLVIPPGGVGELKRRGSSSVVDFYGFIEA